MSEALDGGSATWGAQKVVALMDPHGLMRTLNTGVAGRGLNLLFALALNGYGKVRVISSRRKLSVEQELYGHGRSRSALVAVGVPVGYAQPDRPIVVWCRPEKSKHVTDDAFDLSFDQYVKPNWELVHAVAKECGLTWGGDWKVRDYGHFEG